MSVRLRPVLLLGLLALQAVTVVAVVVGTGRNTEGVLVDAMQRTMMLAVETLDQRTSEHLGPAQSAAEVGAGLLVNGVLPLDDDETILRYLDTQVESNLAITGAYVGRPDGSFLLVSRDGATVEGGTRVKTITVGDDGVRSTTAQRAPSGEVVEAKVDPTDTFDPRTRPWYEAASAGTEVAWTEPYVFFASREPGVTTAMAARDEQGEVIAVVGVDLSLRDLSTFVGRMEVGAGSRSVLVDRAGEMVATADLSQVNVDDGSGGLRRAGIADLTDPVLTAGLAAAGVGAGGGPTDEEVDTPVAWERDEPLVVPFEVDGRRWQIAVAPLAARGTWLAAVMSPEDQFVSPVVDTQRENMLLAVLIGLAVTVVAIPAVLAVSRRVDRLAEHAVTDPVTGVANRRAFDRALPEEIRRATETSPMCLALVDVDRFKEINDTWGHGVGDQVLAVIAARIEGELRERDLVARIGGDEFGVILVDTPLDAASEVLERMHQAVVETPARTDKTAIELSITVGMATTTGAGDTPASLVEAADTALYAAKVAGRNRIERAEPRQAGEADPASSASGIDS